MASDDQVRLAERELRAYLLQRVCALLGCAAAVYMVAVAMLGPYMPWIYGALWVGGVSVGGLWAAKRGFVTTTSLMLVGGLITSIVVTIAQVGLLYNVISLFLLVVLAGLLLGSRGAIGSTLVAVIIGCVSAYLEATGRISPQPQEHLLTAFTISAELVVVGVLLFWSARGQHRILEGLVTTTSTLDHTQQRFAQLVHDLADGVVVTDIEGVILSVNPAIERMMGRPASEFVGRHFWKLPFFAEGSVPPILDNFRRLVAGEELRRVQVEVETDRGPLIVDAAPRLYARADGTLELSATVRDITRQVRAARELAQLEAQLQESRRLEALGRLAGGVAHDFNNWLTLILGNAELIRDEFGQSEELDAISDAARRSTALTQQLLTFARRQPSEPRAVDVRKQLEELLPMLKRFVRRTMVLDAEVTTTATIRIDPSQFEQVVMNLVLNASEAGTDGGRIVLRAENATLEDRAWVSIDVIDDGPGIAEANRGHLFEPFFTTKEHGTGLGLATVHGVVTSAGGRIQLVPTESGSHFNVQLPAEEVEVVQPAPQAARHGFRVLIVDDDDAVRRTVARILKTDFEVHDVPSAIAALDLLESEKFDLVLSDIVMPEMTGTELMGELRERFPELPVVLMSGYARDDDLAQAELADGFVPKPFTPAVLREQIRRIIT